MKVSTPSICWHSKKRVSSVDFQPTPFPSVKSSSSGQERVRLASAGDDEHVLVRRECDLDPLQTDMILMLFLQIWEVELDEKGKLEPKFLCDLNRHQSAVNIVRWSKDGKMLASGDNGSIPQ